MSSTRWRKRRRWLPKPPARRPIRASGGLRLEGLEDRTVPTTYAHTASASFRLAQPFTSTLFVPDHRTITDVDVGLSISTFNFAFPGQVDLIAPDGTAVVLLDSQ